MAREKVTEEELREWATSPDNWTLITQQNRCRMLVNLAGEYVVETSAKREQLHKGKDLDEAIRVFLENE